MKNRKGFTLVELLAVIVIMAILLMVAIPSVNRILQDVRKRTFLNEAKTIYNEAINKYISESSQGFEIKTISSEDDSAIEMLGEKLKYCVILDDKGKVSKLAVGNDRYYIMLDQVKDIESIKKGDVKSGKLGNMQCTADSKDFKTDVECPYDGRLNTGAKYVNGQYTYTYEYDCKNGWAIELTDKNSTDPVTSTICTTVAGKPIVSAYGMFDGSKAVSFDLSSFYTSNITDMRYMFSNTQAKVVDVSGFDTSKTVYMSGMFDKSQFATIDVSHFNTSNVVDMNYMFSSTAATVLNMDGFDTSKLQQASYMFYNSKAPVIDVSHFDTSKVTSMSAMFFNTQAAVIDVSHFDTSNVTDMSSMFQYTKTLVLDVSNFDTSNVTNMNFMFYGTKAQDVDVSHFDTGKVKDMSYMFSFAQTPVIDVGHFNTSNVTNMSSMFANAKVQTLDVSGFDTSNVTNMFAMFNYTSVPILDVSHFNTSKVKNMRAMFSNTAVTFLDLSSFDMSNVTDMEYMFHGTKATTGYARTQADADKLNATVGKPSTLTFTVKG